MLELSLFSEETTKTANIAGVETEIARFTVPIGTDYALPRTFRPTVLKLFKTDGAQIARGARISIFRRIPGQRQDEPLASFGYNTFFGLDEVEQASEKNDRVMTKDLGFARNGVAVQGARFPQESALIFKLESGDVVDMNHPNTAITFDVAEL